MKHTQAWLAAFTLVLGAGTLGGCRAPEEAAGEHGGSGEEHSEPEHRSEAVSDATLPVVRYYVIADT